MNQYKVVKKVEGRWKFYQVVDEKGELIKEFDDYNYQKPARQAKEFIKTLK